MGGVYGSASVTESRVPLGMRAQLEKDRGYQDQQSHTLPVHFIVHNGDFLSGGPPVCVYSYILTLALDLMLI